MEKTDSTSKIPAVGSFDSNRRSLLKKATYTAPTLVALGLLARSPGILADSSVPGPPGGWALFRQRRNKK